MVKNVSKPNNPKQGTNYHNFIASGGKSSEYKASKGSNYKNNK